MYNSHYFFLLQELKFPLHADGFAVQRIRFVPGPTGTYPTDYFLSLRRLALLEHQW